LSAALAVTCTFLLWASLSRHWTWTHWLGCWLVVVNALAFAYYGYDKAQAASLGRRVPEVVLHSLSAVGGSVGSYAAMRLFRHKTIKPGFRILFWCIVTLQVVLSLWIIKSIWWT
jgi:uncharacterized membrane protein YsdA (DUF1294 family)